MKPVIALVGRPNVGKSTLFNRLTRSRDAIVHDVPGVTRDRHYGEGRLGEPALHRHRHRRTRAARRTDGIFAEMARQAEQAIAEADAVIFVVDARAGLTPRRPRDRRAPAPADDAAVARREQGRGHGTRTARSPSSTSWAWARRRAVSAAHGEGVRELMDAVLADFPEEEQAEEKEHGHPRVAIVGRPNVGKSTLVNALVGEERVIAFDQPGTTRDPIEVPFERAGRRYTLIDTAGVRRRGKHRRRRSSTSRSSRRCRRSRRRTSPC